MTFEQVLHQIYQFIVYGLSKGIAVDRLVGFQDLGGKDDFTTQRLEAVLTKKGKTSVWNPVWFINREQPRES